MDLNVTRTFDTTAERVWSAWTEPDLVMRWWGPAGFTAPLARMDVRKGGASLVCMRTPDGHDLFNTWTYEVVRRPHRLEFVMGFSDADARPVEPAALGLPPDVPDGVRHVVTITPSGDGRTKLSVTEHGYASPETVQLSRLGLEQCLDKMAAVV